MHIERKTREQIECEVREALRARGVPMRDDVIDGPPVFDAFHEAVIPYIVDDIDRLWANLADEQRRDAFWRKQGTINERALEHACGVRRMLGFDLSDVRDERFVDEPEAYDIHDDPHTDLGGES